MLEKPVLVRDIHKRLIRDYQVETKRCEEDLVCFLTDLVDEGLITEIQNT